MTMQAANRVLISPAGGQAIYGIVRYFKERGMTVIGIDRNAESIGRFFTDRFIHVPAVNAPSYADTITGIITDYGIDVFISWLDPEIMFWNERYHSSLVPESMERVFAFNFRPDLAEFYDKLLFSKMLSDHGFICPKTFLLTEDKDAGPLHMPVIVKPRVGFGSRDTHKASSLEDIVRIKGIVSGSGANVSAFLVQEFINGPEYTVDFFADMGTVINMSVRKRTEHRGVSLRGEIILDEAIEAYVTRICAAFMISGLNNIQLIEGEEGLYVTDYNPRPSGTIMFSVQAGVDLLNNLLERQQQKEITRYGKPKKLKMVRYLCEYYYE